jgi:dienelactone hydrolase
MRFGIKATNTAVLTAVLAAGLAPWTINTAYASDPAEQAQDELGEQGEGDDDLGAGDAEVVGVETLTVKIPSKLHARAMELPARLVRPKWSKSVGERPAILLMHGSGGLLKMPTDEAAQDPCSDEMEPQFVRWAERLAERGYVVLMPSSYSARGFCDMHTDTGRIPEGFDERPEQIAERLYDFDAAARYLCDRDEVDCDRMGLLGFSHGASMVILGLHWQIDRALANFRAAYAKKLDISLPDLKPGRPDFKVGIAYYPGCGLDGLLALDTAPQAEPKDKYFPSAPLYVLHGGDDPLVEHCDSAHGPGTRQIQAEQVSDHLDRENPYHAVVYAGAHHGFDNSSDGSGAPVVGEDEEKSHNAPADVTARDAALTVALKRLSAYL